MGYGFTDDELREFKRQDEVDLRLAIMAYNNRPWYADVVSALPWIAIGLGLTIGLVILSVAVWLHISSV